MHGRTQIFRGARVAVCGSHGAHARNAHPVASPGRLYPLRRAIDAPCERWKKRKKMELGLNKQPTPMELNEVAGIRWGAAGGVC
jgi:hypothetical protein